MNQVTIQSGGETELLVASDGCLTLSTPIHIKRHGCHKVVTLPDGNVLKTACHLDKPTPLQLALARGYYWLTLVESGRATHLAEVAKQVGKDNAYVSRMVNLTTLAPDIVAAILDESLPATVNLFMLASNTPLLWDEQRARLKSS
ncbi:MAG: LacI family transcriptional regulator [Candidatus Symbiodolus clandestinus]